MCSGVELKTSPSRAGLNTEVSASQPLETRGAVKPGACVRPGLNTEGRSGEAHLDLEGEKLRQEQAVELNDGEQELSLTGLYLGEKPCASLALLLFVCLVLGIVELSG